MTSLLPNNLMLLQSAVQDFSQAAENYLIKAQNIHL